MPVDNAPEAAGIVQVRGEPWGRRLWLSLAAVVIVASCLQSYGINSWPMADDEVPSLVELGLLHIDAPAYFSVPPEQIGRLPRATLVWNAYQRHAIALLPSGDVSYRLPSLLCGVLFSALAFIVAARWRGLWFALALSILVNGSPLFVYLAQLNRFYSLPLLLLALTFLSMWLPRRSGIVPVLVTSVLTLLTVLSHNVTVAAFGLAFGAALPGLLLGRLFGHVPVRVVVRSGAALAVSGLVYLLYLKPLITGWSSTGNPTPVLVSFAAHAGIPALALAALGCWFALAQRNRDGSMVWWVVILAGSLCAFELAPISWNPRYFLFFLPTVWILAAYATEIVARRLGAGYTGAAWYGCVIVLLLPNLFSHFVDGSRHDYRQAAAVVRAHYEQDEPILSDDAETISYYLPEDMRDHLFVRTKVRASDLPESAFLLVCRMNAWMPLPQIPGRQMELLSEIYKRRFDEFSHILRVYRVTAASHAEPRS